MKRPQVDSPLDFLYFQGQPFDNLAKTRIGVDNAFHALVRTELASVYAQRIPPRDVQVREIKNKEKQREKPKRRRSRCSCM